MQVPALYLISQDTVFDRALDPDQQLSINNIRIFQPEQGLV